MKHKLAGNLSLKLVSFIVAFVIWLLVVNIDNPRTSTLIRDVKIQVINEDSVTEIDKVFDITSDQTVVLRVTERKNILNSLTKDDFTVIADMENLNEMDTVPLTVTCSNAAVTWDEIEMVPSSMKVKLEQKKQSDFLVNVVPNGKPQKGYEVGQTDIVGGKTVQIAGPESIINRIGRVEASVNITNINSDKRLKGTLQVYDKNGDSMQMSRLQIKDSTGVLLADNTVMVDITLWEILYDIPVEVKTKGTPADGYRLSGLSTVPVTVSLVGTPEALARLNGKIVLDDTVSVEGATESFTEDLDISKTLDNIEGLQLVEGADPTVSVSVQIEKTGDQTMKIPLSSLEVLNRPEKNSLTFSPADEITVTIHAENESDRISLNDIKASIDLSVCVEPGTYEIPVEIELPQGFSVASEVSLLVTAEAQEPINDENGENTGE